MRDTVVLIPTLEEHAAIGKTLDDVRENAPGCKVLLIDSHSTDGTREIALERGATIIDAPRGGKGRAFRTALPEILRTYRQARFIMLDGDNTYPASYIPWMIGLLQASADVVLGCRARRAPKSMTPTNAFGNKCLSLMASALFRHNVPDVCTGLWGFRREALSRFILTSDGFTLEAELFAEAMKTGCRVKAIPIHYRARLDGDRPKLRVRDGFDIGWFLLKSRLYRTPAI